MNFIIIGLCTKGRLKYQLDTQDQYINAGDMIIVSENRIIDKYESSSDFEGLVMMISINFFHEIIQTVRDVNSLFIFARSHPVISLENKEIEAFKEYFHVIQKRLGDKGNFFRRDLIRSLLLAMLYDVGNFIYRFKETDRPQTRAESFFTRFIKMVEEHCKHERRVGWYALQLGITPIIAPLTHDGQGHMLNINADTMAQTVAVALASPTPSHEGEKLLRDVTLTYCFELPGVMRDPAEPDSLIPHITETSFRQLVADGTISGGMIPKLENAFAAIHAGVTSVRITHISNLQGGTVISSEK